MVDWRVVAAPLLAILIACSGAGDHVTSPPANAGSLVLSVTGLTTLDTAREGSYEAWVVDGAGQPHGLGKFTPASTVTLTLATPVPDVRSVLITIEPPGDADAVPSVQRLLQGTFSGARADLSILGAVTLGDLALRDRPGQFTIFTPSDNGLNGYPSHEEAGIWLFNMAPFQTPQQDMWVRLTQLQPGWIYESWAVRDFGLSGAVWFSCGKFRPDQTGAVNARDDSGWGPFSGVLDFADEDAEEFPGDDFISNPLGLPVPGNLSLPLNLLEKTVVGDSRWTYVITIEQAWNKGETYATERPFLLRPYYEPVGSGGPGVPRTITLRGELVPHGSAELR